MPIEITAGSLMQIPEPYSDRPLMFWSDAANPSFNTNFMVLDPASHNLMKTRFRVINVQIDLTDPNGTAIVYLAENGKQVAYTPFTNGWHPVIGWGIVSVASGVTSWQVGI